MDTKEKISQYVDSIANELNEISDYIFDNPELGLKEYKASARLCDFLEKYGFEVERGIAGMDTAFRAVWKNGEGGPSIGLLCEYDALAQLGHGCGHHTQGPCIVGAAQALKEVYKDKPYQIVVYGTPAEETVGGKITMLEHGYFNDIDVALMMHLNPDTCVDVHSMALNSYVVTYHGKSAHAAIRPEWGRSALDGLMLAFHGLECLREHVKDDTRIHYTVVDAGGPANVVPAKAVGSIYVRSYSRPYLDNVVERVLKIFNGAAMMSDTTVDIEILKAIDAKIPVFLLNDLLMKNAEVMHAPGIDKPREKTGSTDFGNVMYRIPGSCIRMKFVPSGSVSHSQTYVDAGKSDDAHIAVTCGAKIIAATSYDLIAQEGLMDAVKEEFQHNLAEAKAAM